MLLQARRESPWRLPRTKNPSILCVAPPRPAAYVSRELLRRAMMSRPTPAAPEAPPPSRLGF